MDLTSSVQPEFWITALKSMGMLCIVIAVLIGMLYGLNRVVYRRGRYGDRRGIHIVASCHIAPKQRILIADVYGRKLVLGATAHAITCLDKIGEGELEEPFNDGRSEGFLKLFKRKVDDSVKSQD